MTEIVHIAATQELDDPSVVLGQLADLSAQKGYYGLQDANLVLVEAISKLPAETDLPLLLTAWTLLVKPYLSDPSIQLAKEISIYLRRPELGIAMDDEEFELLEQQLCSDATVSNHKKSAIESQQLTIVSLSPSPLELQVDEQINLIDGFADQAAASGYYGLQDANLLLSEALRKIDLATVDTDFVSVLKSWPELNKIYFSQPIETISAILDFLRQPALKIPMDEDEFTLLEEQLQLP